MVKNPKSLLPLLGPSKLFFASLTAIAVIGLGDYLSGPELSFSLFYVFPIGMVTWYGKPWMGTMLSVVAGIFWMAADALSGHQYSHPGILYWNSFIRFGFFILVSFLLNLIRQLYQREELLADTDGLTGLRNRRSFLETADIEVERSKRYLRPVTLAYIDLDNFKKVNDTLGHGTGDELLTRAADCLKSNLRKSDSSARMGGDEFACILPEAPFLESQRVLEKIQGLLLKAMEANHWPVTFSIGAVTFEKPLGEVKDMIKLADDLMYFVKKNQKNSLVHVSYPPKTKEMQTLLENLNLDRFVP